MKKEIKKFAFEIKSIEEDRNEDGNFGIIKGYASTFGNIDLGNDRVMPGAFQDSIKNLKEVGGQLIMLYQHNEYMPIGGFDVLIEDQKGLYVEGKINLDIQKGKETYLLMKQKVLRDFSIGYFTKDFSYKKEGNKEIRELEKLELIETSIVIKPMNPEAIVTNVKSVTPFRDLPLADREMEWDSESAIQRVREFTGSEESPSSSYKNAFIWYDRENENNFTAYKLPYADVIDGELVAIPRAIFAAAAALQGARGGVDIPDSDRARAERHLERYYDKMDMDSPFKTEDSFKSITDVSKALKEKGFSNKEANKIIHFIKSLSRNDDNDTENIADRNELGSKIEIIKLNENLNETLKRLKGVVKNGTN